MLLELHIIQNFAPSNLNRDDTGAPKSCEFGGYRRARISSQSIKRAIRMEFKNVGLPSKDTLADRSKRFVEEIATRLVDAGQEPEQAQKAIETVLGAIGLNTSKDKGAQYEQAIGGKDLTFRKSEYLLFLGRQEVDRLTEFCLANWNALQQVAGSGDAKGAEAKKAAKDAAATALSKTTVDALKASLDGGKAADLALFGRMLADLPERNIDAASQVAHAISTHQVSSEFDYYTAVDDLKPSDTAGADMIGTVEFNSACFYRYANIDIGQLSENLGGDQDLVEATLKAFLLASRDAIPTGKQNSFAARNVPAFFFTVVRDSGAWSLANAFAEPARAGRDGGLIAASIKELDKHWGELVTLYGEPAGAKLAVAALGQPALEHLKPHQVDNFAALLERTLEAARPVKAG